MSCHAELLECSTVFVGCYKHVHTHYESLKRLLFYFLILKSKSKKHGLYNDQLHWDTNPSEIWIKLVLFMVWIHTNYI